MTFGFRRYSPANPRTRPHCPFVFLRSRLCSRPFRARPSRIEPGLRLRLASPPPLGSFHPNRSNTCQTHERRSPDRLTTFLNPTFSNAPPAPHAVSALAAKPIYNPCTAIRVFHTPEFCPAPALHIASQCFLTEVPLCELIAALCPCQSTSNIRGVICRVINHG